MKTTTIIMAFILGICATITYMSVRTVITMQTAVSNHEQAIAQLVGFINQSIEASKAVPANQ